MNCSSWYKYTINFRERDRNVHIRHRDLADDTTECLVRKRKPLGISLNKTPGSVPLGRLLEMVQGDVHANNFIARRHFRDDDVPPAPAAEIQNLHGAIIVHRRETWLRVLSSKLPGSSHPLADEPLAHEADSRHPTEAAARINP